MVHLGPPTVLWPLLSFRQEMAGMSPDLGRDDLGSEKLYTRELWADFLFPKSEGIAT